MRPFQWIDCPPLGRGRTVSEVFFFKFSSSAASVTHYVFAQGAKLPPTLLESALHSLGRGRSILIGGMGEIRVLRA